MKVFCLILCTTWIAAPFAHPVANGMRDAVGIGAREDPGLDARIVMELDACTHVTAQYYLKVLVVISDSVMSSAFRQRIMFKPEDYLGLLVDSNPTVAAVFMQKMEWAGYNFWGIL
ncbi:hypothetical protein FB451DRAFT_1523707 [Mycena latifolia]|nr:hypothetical protein FB451DRAFT_1523707 [Mycena latifolia]